MTWGEQNTEAEAHEQLSYACVDRGINFLDTAEMYPVPTKPVRRPAREVSPGQPRRPRAVALTRPPVASLQETQGRTEKYIGAGPRARPPSLQVKGRFQAADLRVGGAAME